MKIRNTLLLAGSLLLLGACDESKYDCQSRYLCVDTGRT